MPDPSQHPHSASEPVGDHQGHGAAPNGSQPPHGPAAEPMPAPEPERDAAERMAARALDLSGGLVARVDQIETRVVRVDRQLLMLIGMVAVVAWSVKSLAGKLDALELEVPGG